MTIDASLVDSPAPGLRSGRSCARAEACRTRRSALFEAKAMTPPRSRRSRPPRDVAATFSRHFRAKEDVVLWDDFAPTLFGLFAEHRSVRPSANPSGGPPQGLRLISPRSRADAAPDAADPLDPGIARAWVPAAGLMMGAFAPLVRDALNLPPDDVRARIFAGRHVRSGHVRAVAGTRWRRREEVLDIVLGALTSACSPAGSGRNPGK